MKRFIYVFCQKDRKVLEDIGFKLIQADQKTETFIFENKAELNFATHVSSGKIGSFITSDSLTL